MSHIYYFIGLHLDTFSVIVAIVECSKNNIEADIIIEGFIATRAKFYLLSDNVN